MERWQLGWVWRLKIYFLCGWSTWCARGLWHGEGCIEKRVRTWNVLGNVLERVTKITKSGGKVEPNVVSIDVSWKPCCNNWVNGWHWTKRFVGTLLHMQDYVNPLVALGTKQFNSPLVKHRLPSSFEKHSWTLFWCSVTVLMKEYRSRSCLGMDLAYWSEITSFCCLEQSLNRGWTWVCGGGEAWITYLVKMGS